VHHSRTAGRRQNPDDVGGILVPLAKPLAVHAGILDLEDFRPGAPLLVPLVAPTRQQADIHAERLGLLDDVIDVVPVVVIGTFLDVRLVRVVVDERLVAVGVRHMEPVQLRQGHRLNHREALGRPVLQVLVGFLAVETVAQLPGRVAQVEERRPVRVNEKAFVVRDPQGSVIEIHHGLRRRFRRRQQRQQQTTENADRADPTAE
jgi:hypothetical protein